MVTTAVERRRLMGCQDLLEDVPGRSRREKDNSSSPGDLRSFVKGVTGRSSSKSYSVKDETSSKCAAINELPMYPLMINQLTGQTIFSACHLVCLISRPRYCNKWYVATQ